MDTVPTLEDRLNYIRKGSAVELQNLMREFSLESDSRIPHHFLSSLDDANLVICWRAILICYTVTHGQQIHREMQLQAVLADHHGLDCLISAGTGSGKTLPTALKILLDDPAAALTTITLFPLKRLLVTQENDFNSKYGICTVVINQDTPQNDAWWDKHVFNLKIKKPGLARHLIVTVEQMFKGHFARLANLLRNNHFQKRVIRVVVDEAHNIHTAGLAHYGLDAFRPAWGRLDEIKAILPPTTRWCSCSAALTPLVLKSVEAKVLRPDYVPIHLSSNRPNTTYAINEVVNSIEDLQNYQCFLVTPFVLEKQPRVLIFVDDIALAMHIRHFLDSLLPPQFKERGVVFHHHSVMSEGYLKQAHEAFTTSNGACRIMIVAWAQSVGINFPDLKIVCMAGLPSTTIDILQRGGRAYRNSAEDALCLIFYDPWVHDVDLSTFTNFDPADLDRPRATLKSDSPCQESVPYHGVKCIHDKSCIRKQFALYLDDQSPDALRYTTQFCCNFCHPDSFDLQAFLPGKLYTLPPPTDDSTIKRKRVSIPSRPRQERPTLDYRLIEWLKSVHALDPLQSVRPIYYILSNLQRANLVRTQAQKIRSVSDIQAILNKNDEWASEWGYKIFEVIRQYDSDLAAMNDVTSISSTEIKLG